MDSGLTGTGNPTRHAVLDIGSNTVRLLVADLNNDGRFRELHASQVITRLAENAHESKVLSEEAMERTIAGVDSLINGAASFRPFLVSAAATHAVRRASNGGRFAALFKMKLGFPLTVIPWEREASLSLDGATAVVGRERPIVLFDIGGGSTEFIYREPGGTIRSAGTELGVVRLSESYIKHAPLVWDEYRILSDYLRQELSPVAVLLAPRGDFTLVGTAGTVTSIAAIIYNVHPFDPAKVNNRLLRRDAVEELLHSLGKMTLAQRNGIPSLEHGREDLIIPGICIVLVAMEAFGVESVTVSDAGLREGLLVAAMTGGIPCHLI